MKRILACFVLLLGLQPISYAHHSGTMFDYTKLVEIKGTVKEFQYTNPHSWFYIDVKDEAGNIAHWAFEAGTPSGMIRNGYKASVIKQGDVVTVTGFRAKDPSQNMAMLRELTIADGTVFGLFGPQESPAAK